LVQLRKLDRNNQKRRKLVEAYRKELEGTGGILIPFPKYGTRPSYHLFPVLISPSVRRNKVMEGLRSHGIQTSIHYPPVHLFSLYRKEFGYGKGMLPITEEVGRREITLPLHPLMEREDVKRIVGKLKDVIRKV
jgi:dTDP-4-amino-4,6-dideoxygalactose transaminase